MEGVPMPEAEGREMNLGGQAVGTVVKSWRNISLGLRRERSARSRSVVYVLAIVTLGCLVWAPPVLGQAQRGSPVLWGQGAGPVRASGSGPEYVAVAAGAYHCLLLNADGTVTARGENAHGQCNIPWGQKITAVAAGFYHSLVLRSDGSIAAWGDNTRGQRDVPSGSDFVAIGAGQWHNLAIRSDGSLAAWGWNEYGQCDVPDGNDFEAVSGGLYHSLALQSDGSLVAWGGNGDGQCDVPVGNDFAAIAAGSLHSLALRSDGSLVAWGRDDFGQCKVPQGNDFAAIAAGAFHNLALRSNGAVIAWGYNSYAQCDVPPTNYVAAIAAGGFRSLALETGRQIVEVAPSVTEMAIADVVEPVEPNDGPAESVSEPIEAADTGPAAIADANGVEPDPVETAVAAEPNEVSETTVERVEVVTSEPAEVPDANMPALAAGNGDPEADPNVPESEPVEVAHTEMLPADVNRAEPEDSNQPEAARANEPAGTDANTTPDGSAEPAPTSVAAETTESPTSKRAANQTAQRVEGVEFYACADPQNEGTRPVYHFTSQTLTPHFYTISKEERDRLIDEHPDVWTYEGAAFHAYPEGSQPEGAVPVYRFWSSLLSTHFYTIDENEKNAYIKEYPDLCTYQGIAWYADPADSSTNPQKIGP